MALALVPYTAEWAAAARAFNERMRAAGVESDVRIPPAPAAGHHLVVDGETVRGACLCEVETARIGGGWELLNSFQSPVTEGLFDSRHAAVSPWMMREVLRRWPYSYSVGMGSLENPFPKLLKALRWTLLPVPFHFHVLRGGNFARQMPALQRKPAVALVARIIPGLAALGVAGLQAWRGRAARGAAPVGLEQTTAFTAADGEAWRQLAPRLTFAAGRDPETLNARYPEAVQQRDGLILGRFAGGILVLKVRRFTGHHYFGNLTVATWADGLALPGQERELVAAAAALAERAGADLVITNQLYPPVVAALETHGWFSYPSNYLVAWSPALAAVAGPGSSLVSRRDGDGLVNL